MLTTKNSSSAFPWKLLIVEAFLVVASVLLALGLNSWLEARSNQALAERALLNVVEEVKTNCTRIESSHSYHQAVVNGDAEPAGIQSGLLRNDAWDAAKTTDAATHLDYGLVVGIGKINAYQRDHRLIVQAYVQALFAIMLQTEELQNVHKKSERGVIRELVQIQSNLLEEYHSLLALVEEHYGDSIKLNGICGNR